MIVFSGTLQDLANQLLKRSNHIDYEYRPSVRPKISLPAIDINDLEQVIENLSASNGQPLTYLGQLDYPVELDDLVDDYPFELHGQVVNFYQQPVKFAYDPQTQQVTITLKGQMPQ
ncbi:hypothetical protein [Nostoc sp. FACHB-190]|uniref:hypothetical protein n=1 Tax=Nostoc sp. FACHB-190 TaxID=2692838 RepID=UPI001683A9DD|nr:hypothetical protein [Nostoc sp. FACHB-190]MBD2302619.1 hypothetical protein [Nostoc sp. FACHB-190]